MRSLALLLLVSAAAPALADEIDLTRGSRRSSQEGAPTWVIRAEGGNEFAPFGYIGGAVSWLAGPYNQFELGAGGGFPGVQLGLTVKQLFGEAGPLVPFLELSIAGNTRVNRGKPTNVDPTSQNSVWTCLGLGFEQRGWIFDLSIAGDIVFTTVDLTPHWSVHGGIGFGF